MARGDGLGRVFNVAPTASGVEINLVGASAVSFVCVGDDTYTLQESVGAAGTPQNLAVIERYHRNLSAAGANAWVDHEQAAAATVDADSAAVTVFSVRADQLTDGYTHVRVNSTTGLVTAITHDLLAGRKPSNLPPLGA